MIRSVVVPHTSKVIVALSILERTTVFLRCKQSNHTDCLSKVEAIGI